MLNCCNDCLHVIGTKILAQKILGTDFGTEFWVRYEEHQEGSGNDGSLVAPFAGEHGWYWLNYNEFPVVVTLTINGYFDEIIDYGIF